MATTDEKAPKTRDPERIQREADWRMRVFDSLSFPTLILRPDRTIIAANQIFLETIGVCESQVVGKTCRDIFNRYLYSPSPTCDETRCPLANVLASKSGHSVLKRVPRRDGSVGWEDRVFSPILDEKGDIRYVIESFRDVTRVKRLESMYQDMRAQMDRIVQSSPSAIVSADLNGRILLMNPAAEDLFACRADHTAHMRIDDFYPAGLAREIMAKLRDDALGGVGKLPMTQINILTCDGREVPVEMTAAIIYEQEREVATMGIYNDLRSRLAVERQLEAAQVQVQQSEKMASLGRLAAGVAHEINNPLTGILMYASMIRERIDPSQEMAKNLTYIVEDAERCRDIVKDLLTYSRQTQPTRELIRVDALLEESLNLIRDQRLFMNVKVVKDFADTPLYISADKKQLHQVFINLVMNAVDAMAGSGTLHFRSYHANGGESVYIEISDSGSGIDAAHVSRVFDPFFTTKGLGEGTGLGLSTVYGIVKRNQGSIQVKATSDKGTTFQLEFPTVGSSAAHSFESIG